MSTLKACEVAHITFQINTKEKTFSLVPGEAVHSKDRKPLFSGVITPEMPGQLEQLALRLRLLLAYEGEQSQ
tara:strand:- start:6928 stop:7143 length:216 start_codon:yes stop_codon:yes gene_type:complete